METVSIQNLHYMAILEGQLYQSPKKEHHSVMDGSPALSNCSGKVLAEAVST